MDAPDHGRSESNVTIVDEPRDQDADPVVEIVVDVAEALAGDQHLDAADER